jgi:uncharacterized protein (DUF488 family)
MAAGPQTGPLGKRVHTVGHSTRSLEDLVEALRHHGVDLLVDIRGYPGSRRTPQFNAEALEAELPRFGLGYLHLPQLGGRRRAREGSPNSGWRNKSFRGYADHMQTDTFRDGIDRLLVLAERGRPAIMCAEAVPWRCHRSLVGDALLVRGVEVVDIMATRTSRPHTLTSFAQVEGETIVYPDVE